MLAGVITAKTAKEAIEDTKKAKNADLIELRVDYFKSLDISEFKKIIKLCKKPIIITIRKKDEGGFFSGSEIERLSILRKSLDFGADYIDVEYSSDKKLIRYMLKNKKNTKIIVSYHNFKETPKNIKNIYNKIRKLNPDLIKIATNAASINDNFKIFNLLKNKKNLIAFCMGQKGEISRILAHKFGSRITYASLGKNKESAPGQISLEDMNNIYHVNLINHETNVIGIIGEFAENSMSKYMHNPNFVKNGLNFVYVPFKVARNGLSQFMRNFRKFSFKGAAVTIPHKEDIIKYIDELDETAKQIGAVNTLVNENNKITGYNTDYYGAVMALKEITNLKNKKILVIGAGGAARAVVYGLKKEGAEITIANRTEDKARKLASEFKVDFGKFSNVGNLTKQNNIIINTTSLGMQPFQDSCILKENDMPERKIVMDAVYKPTITKLIKLARRKKCQIITGDRMLIYQAVKQFELWTKVNPGFKPMKKELIKCY